MDAAPAQCSGAANVVRPIGHEALGVGGVGVSEDCPLSGTHLPAPAKMNRLRGEQADACVAVIVVAPPRNASSIEPMRSGKPGRYLSVLK